MKQTKNNKLSHGVKKTAVASFIALSFSGNVQAIETFLKHDFTRGVCQAVTAGEWSNVGAGGYHTGDDYYCGQFGAKLKTVAFGKIDFRNTMTDDGKKCLTKCGRADHGMGNVLDIKYVLSDGNEVIVSYNHLSKFSDFSKLNNYVTADQYVAFVGASGQQNDNYWNPPHLHVEVRKKHRTAISGKAPWGYASTSQSVFDNGYLKLSDYIDIKEIALPILSKTVNPNRTTNYDVFGIANAPIYGYLNLSGKFTQSGIVARHFASGDTSRKRITESGDLKSNALTSPKFLGGTNDNLSVNGITPPPTNYDAGDYLFAAYVKQGSDTRYGYPVKFSVVNEGSVIVDNDQRNADSNNDNDSKTEPAYNEKLDVSNPKPAEKVPGYFLTANLHVGRSGAVARWLPYKSSRYKIYVHIPEYGATATEVYYSIKGIKNGLETITKKSKPINQAVNADKWVPIVAEDNTDEFELTTEGYLSLWLDTQSGGANYDTTNQTKKVAFDAVKFESTCDGNHPCVEESVQETPVITNETFPTDGYSKIANDGSKLADSANLGANPKDWACTRDNKTGLIWEVKTSDGGLRDMNNSYTNYTVDYPQCEDVFWGIDGYCAKEGLTGKYRSSTNTDGFVTAVNNQSLCGSHDWQLPTNEQLKSLVYCSDGKYNKLAENESGLICANYISGDNKTINTIYFPDIEPITYPVFWSSSPVSTKYGAWDVGFYNGATGYNHRSVDSFKVRLVRNPAESTDSISGSVSGSVIPSIIGGDNGGKGEIISTQITIRDNPNVAPPREMSKDELEEAKRF